MSILRKMANYVRSLTIREPDAWVDGSMRGDAGEVVTDNTALSLSAVWACRNLLAGTISSLPLMVYRTNVDGAREVARNHPLYRILHDSPNFEQTAVDFLDFLSSSIELRGNGYARVRREGARIVSLVPIPSDRMTVRRKASGALEYQWTDDRGRQFTEAETDILHVRGPGGNSLSGMSTLEFGRNAFSLARATDKAAAGMFRNGLRPSVVLKFKNWLSKEQRDLTETRLTEKYSGAVNAGRPFILEGDTELSTISMSPEDAQMLESRSFSVEEICRFFGVPPFMIGHTEKSTSWGTGLEQQTLGFLKFSLRHRLKRIEQAFEKQLLTPADRAAGIMIEFNIEGLLRADSAGRAAFYREMTQMGAMTINEVRARENLPKVDGGDVPRMQSQNVPITEAGQAPALPQPQGN
ncbi:MAG: phage portal protein [Aurantimonas endophytica]|uniref:phage portal protein n=1 Tax=Aurantimonas endophytica TaxID=1522175 RepID=UPI0030014E1D